MSISKRYVLVALVVCAIIFSVASATEDAAPPKKAGNAKAAVGARPRQQPHLRNRRNLLGANYGPADYRAGSYGPSWGFSPYYSRPWAMVRFPNLPDEGRMETSNDRRFAMVYAN